MATVRITETLRGEVYEKFRLDFRLRRDKKLNAILARFDQGLILDAAWQSWLNKFNITDEWLKGYPTAWMISPKTINVKSINGVVTPMQSIPTVPGKLYPIYFINRIDGNYSHWHEIDNPDLSEQAALCVEFHDAQKTMMEEESAALATIRKVLDNCTTLKQALEVWPQLIDLLPDWALAKHKEPEKRYSNSNRVSLSQDALDQINTAVVINKITKAL